MIKLRKDPGRDFVLLNLSDPQLSDGEWEAGHKNRAILEYTVSETIKRVSPDLITISGDLAWAGQTRAYHMLADLIESYSIPWCAVWGNHDNQDGPGYIDSIADYYLSKAHFVYEKGDKALGNGNYVISVESGGRIVSGVIMMDSHDRMPYTKEDGTVDSGWAKLLPEQIVWYEEQVNALRAAGCPDSVLIMHIPVYAYRDALAAAYLPDADKKAITPLDSALGVGWNEDFRSSYGVTYESIGSYPADDGVFDVIHKLGHTKILIAGHDHVNNTVINYRGVDLVYSLKCGAGCYWDPRLNGGTVVRFGDGGIRDLGHCYIDVNHLL